MHELVCRTLLNIKHQEWVIQNKATPRVAAFNYKAKHETLGCLQVLWLLKTQLLKPLYSEAVSPLITLLG